MNSAYEITPWSLRSKRAESHVSSLSVGWKPFLYISLFRSSLFKWPCLYVSTAAKASWILNEGRRVSFFFATSIRWSIWK